MDQSCAIDEELSIIESIPLMHSVLPEYLLNSFKKDLNDTIVSKLVSELDHLIDSVDTNNSLRILSLNDDPNNTTLSHHYHHHSNVSATASMSSQSTTLVDAVAVGSKSVLLDIATRLASIFGKYSHRLKSHLVRFDTYMRKYANVLKLPTPNEVLLYQRAILVDRLDSRHYNLLNVLFKNVFDYYQRLTSDYEIEGDDHQRTGEELLNNTVLEQFHQINRILFDLTLFDHLCGDVVVEVVEIKIQEHIESTSMDNYQESFIVPFENWLNKIIIGWIELIYSCSSEPNVNGRQFSSYLASYRKQLAHFMYTHYTHTRIKRLFDIVIDYPDSKPALDDLKVCLSKTQLRSHVVKSLRTSIEQRLLHPGVNTSDILTAYVSAIKALLCLDPSGIMMENICEPLKKYLRSREDTIKCIVSNLTDDPESSNDLMEDFCKDLYPTETTSAVNGAISPMDAIDSAAAQLVAATSKAWLSWQPDPIESLSLIANNNTGGDSTSPAQGDLAKSNIITMLVNIYGSKDLFVNEYKTLLGDRLLSNYAPTNSQAGSSATSVSGSVGSSSSSSGGGGGSSSSGINKIETEIRNLELLKLRFGESSLYPCEAMLRDIAESRRINANILEQLVRKDVKRIGELDVSVHTLKSLVLSEQFWPKLKEEKVEMPEELKAIQQKYVEAFEAFKGNRTLIWKNNLGQVSLEIDINGQKLEFSVTPIHAAVIMKFEEKSKWTLSDLAHSLKMCSFALRKKLAFWKAQGLVYEATSNEQNQHDVTSNDEVYCLVKESNAKLGRRPSRILVEEDENEQDQGKNNDDSEGKSGYRKSELLREPELTLYWNYTQSMLRNVGCLPLERIHNWLKLYANANITLEQTKYLCDFKVKEEVLKFNGGLYRLVK